MRARVAVAGLFHETHTFLEGWTPFDAFEFREGADLLASRGDASPLDGFLEVAEQEGWQLVPTVDMRAMPGPTVEDAAVEAYWQALRRHLVDATAEGRLDGLFLVLHGAMASHGHPDVEGEILDRIAGLFPSGRPPIVGVLDLHANVSARMVAGSDALVAYRENPHTDAREASVRAARLFARILDEGVRPRQRWRAAPIVWPPTGTGSADPPLATLAALARRLERDVPGAWAISVIAGFSFADTYDTGVSFVAVGTGESDAMEAALEELVETAWRERALGSRVDPPVAEVLDALLPIGAGPVVLAEPADNVGGGAPGDGTGLLRALLERDVPNSLVILDDPAAVRGVADAAIGARRTLDLGGRGSRLDPGPVRVEVEVVSRSDGRFTLEDPRSHLASMAGTHIDMGPCAVVRAGPVTILLTSRKTPPFDLGILRSQGLEPTKFDLIGVKAAVAHRRAFDPIAVDSLSVDTPGPCSSDLRRLPYQRLRRPIYPLDEVGGAAATDAPTASEEEPA